MTNMQPGLLGQKIGMTQIYDSTGSVVPVTVIDLTGNTVVLLKTEASKDGYNAVQIGFGKQKTRRHPYVRLAVQPHSLCLVCVL